MITLVRKNGKLVNEKAAAKASKPTEFIDPVKTDNFVMVHYSHGCCMTTKHSFKYSDERIMLAFVEVMKAVKEGEPPFDKFTQQYVHSMMCSAVDWMVALQLRCACEDHDILLVGHIKLISAYVKGHLSPDQAPEVASLISIARGRNHD